MYERITFLRSVHLAADAWLTKGWPNLFTVVHVITEGGLWSDVGMANSNKHDSVMKPNYQKATSWLFAKRGGLGRWENTASGQSGYKARRSSIRDQQRQTQPMIWGITKRDGVELSTACDRFVIIKATLSKHRHSPDNFKRSKDTSADYLRVNKLSIHLICAFFFMRTESSIELKENRTKWLHQ